MLDLVNLFTGEVLFPFPNCPDVFSPALYAVPSFPTANEVAFPAEILAMFSKLMAVPASFNVVAGINTLLWVVFPCANCPEVFSPPTYTFPSLVKATV